MSSHTPGPWKVDSNTPGDVNGPGGRDVAVTLFSGMPRLVIPSDATTIAVITECEARANARLIAAAPDLLEALRDMVSDRDCLSSATIDFARAAIAKAEGRP